MPRVRKGAARRQAKKRILKSVKGHRGPAGHLLRLAKEASIRAEVYARKDRKRKKRDFRSLWVVRVNAACRERGIRYGEFIHGCKKAGIRLNRKMLSEIAIADPQGFDAVAEEVRAVLA